MSMWLKFNVSLQKGEKLYLANTLSPQPGGLLLRTEGRGGDLAAVYKISGAPLKQFFLLLLLALNGPLTYLGKVTKH